MSELTIAQLVERSHALSKEKGWYETWPDGRTKAHAVNVPEKLALIHSEVSEALEEFRNHGVLRRCDHCGGTGSDPIIPAAKHCGSCAGAAFMEMYDGRGYALDDAAKPEGFIVELADAVIRVCDLAGAMNLDLAAAIETKHRYNKTRPYRHGGKAC
jgi:hypothetical protein